MISSSRPPRFYPVDFIKTLQAWANSPEAEKNLEVVFGQEINWAAAYRHIERFQRGDISNLPPVKILPGDSMPGLWGGYSRDLRLVFLSAYCPEELIIPVLLEEVGHFLDQEFCKEETPGDEGALFSALVLGNTLNSLEAEDDALWDLEYAGSIVPVEAAPKIRGNAAQATTTTKVRATVNAARVVADTTTSQDGNVVYANKDSVRLAQTKANQRVIGSKGNDTFVVKTQDVRLEDPNGGTDTVETSVSFSLSNFSFIENLTAVSGTAALSLTGNAKANIITGNSGNNVLDGGLDSQKDTLIGGAGNDTYIIRDSLDVISDSAGTDVIFTTNQSLSLSSYSNIESIVFIGSDGADSMTGGGGAGTLMGGKGNDTYFVDHIGDSVSEADSSTLTGGVDWVNSRISHTLGSNIENLVKSGNANVSLTGNALANIIDGSAGGINTLSGGAGNDTLIANVARLGKVDGGANTDFLKFVGNSLTLNNAVLTNIEALDLTLLMGSAAVTLGSNSGSLESLHGSNGNDTITVTAALTTTIDGATGDDRFAFNSGQMANVNLIGGEGSDTLAFTNAGANLDDSDIGAMSFEGIEVIELNGIGNGVTLGANAEAVGISTIVGGIDNDTIDASGYTEGITIDVSRNKVVEGVDSENTITGGQAGDLILFSNYNVLAASSVDGEAGIDTLSFAEDGVAITDDKFVGNIYSIEVFQTNDGTNFIQIGSNALSSGLETIIGGAGEDTFDAAEFTGSIFIAAGDGADSITLKDAASTGTSSVAGGEGSDTLALSEMGPLADTDLLNISGVEVLQASDSGSNTLVIGQNARAAGIQMVVGGIDKDTLDARDFVGAVTLDGGEDNDSFIVAAGHSLRSQAVNGGNGIDTLSFTVNALSVSDTDFAIASSIEFLQTANGNNRISLGASAQAVGLSTIQGGNGRDTLSASGFSGNVTLISGTGKTAALLGDFLIGGAGADSLAGSDKADVLNGGVGIDTMEGGLGNDTYYIGDDGDWAIEGVNSGANLLIVDQNVSTFNTVSGGGTTSFSIQGLVSIQGGAGNDSITGFTTAPLKSTSLNDTIDGDAGNDTIAGGRGKDSLLGSAGNDSILGEDGNDTLLGGNDNDTILAGAGNDSVLGEAGNDSLVAGTGMDTLRGGDGNDTFIFEPNITGSATLDGGAHDDVFQISSAAQLAANSIVGGEGDNDEIVLTGGGIFADEDFSKVSGVEIFDASVQQVSRVSLGGNALRAGIRTLIGSDNHADFLSAARFGSEEITISAGSGNTQDTLVAGSGGNKSSLVGNAGANYFEVGLASLLGNHTIDGGAGIDGLSIERIAYGEGFVGSETTEDSLIGGDQEFTDNLFKYTSNIDAVYYDNRYFNSLELGEGFADAFGANTTASLFSTEDSDFSDGSPDEASDYIDLSEITTKKVYLDVNHEIFGATIEGGRNANTLVGGRKSTADDLFIFQEASWLVGSSIVGGGGNDTLRVSGNAQDINSANFDMAVDVLDITGAGNKVTLAGNSGITSIVGGSGPNTLDASNYDLGNKTLSWDMRRSIGGDSLLGGVQGNLFQIKNSANLKNSIIIGNTGEDTLQILSGAETLGDAFFEHASNAEILILGSAAKGNNITLGLIAEATGIQSVIGGIARETIDASAYNADIYIDASASAGAHLQGSSNSDQNTLIGGALGGNEFEVGALGSNSIVGGLSGDDTLTFTTTTTIDDSIFNGNIDDFSPNADLSNIGVLKFTGANNVISLGKDALASGILTLIGGEGNDNGSDFDTTDYLTVGVLFQVTDQFYLRNSNITGSDGVDTLKFSRDGVSVTDENVANLTNIDVLRTANGNNHFLIHNAFVAAGIDSIIGGTGRDTIDMSDDAIYTPAAVNDMITMDMSAGSGYTLVATTTTFPFAKVIGGNTPGSVIIDGQFLDDNDFANMYQANIGTLFMRVTSDNFVTLGENAKASGLDTLTMSDGDDAIDVTDFLGTLAVRGGGGDDIARTSFAALANLTFIGGDGDDTLRLTDADARAITSLAGSFEALLLNAGNNFVQLANDAGLSTIYGGTGIDTISMLSNTTGIDFVMDATKLGATSGFASLEGGSGEDTLTVHSVGGVFADIQFARVGSVNLAVDLGAIENFETEITANNTYTLGTNAYLAGIKNIYAHGGDVLNATVAFSEGDPLTDRALNFVFATEDDLKNATVTGTGAIASDTLTLTEDGQTVTNATFANKLSVETLVLANGTNIIALAANAQSAGLGVVIGGSGNDQLTFDTTRQTNLVFNGGEQTTFDSAIISNSGAVVTDAYFDDWTSVERLTTGNGNNNIALGANAVAASIATVTGGTGNDTFNASTYTIAVTLGGNDGNDSLISGSGNDSLSGGNGTDWIQATSATAAGGNQIDTLTGSGDADTFVLGDASNCYYNTAVQGGDYVLITDFANGDKLRLKTLDAAAAGNGYVVGNAIYGVLGSSNYYLYRDTNNNGTVEDGDNLIAGINSSVALTTANLKSTHGDFV